MLNFFGYKHVYFNKHVCREPKYKQIKMRYQISKCLNIGQLSILKYRVSQKKVYLFQTSISQALNIAQNKLSTRNESMDVLAKTQNFPGFLV